MFLLVPKLRYRPRLGIRLTRGWFNEVLVIVAHIYVRGKTLFSVIFAKVSSVFCSNIKELLTGEKVCCYVIRIFDVFSIDSCCPVWLFPGLNLTSCSRLTPPIVRMAIFERREGTTYRMIAIGLSSFLAIVVTASSMNWTSLGYLISLGLLHVQLTCTGSVE